MDASFSLKTALTDVLTSLSEAVAAFLPKALTALVVVLVGFVLAMIVAKAIRTLFSRFRLNDLLEKVGLTGILSRLGLTETPGFLLSRLIYYLIILLFVQSGAQAVGLHAVSDSITAFFAYLPNLLAALILLIIGMLVAQFAGTAVTRSAREGGVEFAPLLGRVVSSLVVFITGLMAVTQLGIQTDVIRSVVLVLLAGGSLALALSFGLGSREITRNMLAGFYARKIFRPGAEIRTSEYRGKLAGITPVHTILETDDGIITLPNGVFLDEAARQ